MDEVPSFKSRLLSTYRTDLPGGKQGCFFYIKETQCICLLDTPYRKGDRKSDVEGVHKSEIELSENPDCQVAWGFPAYMLAGGMDKPRARYPYPVKELCQAYLQAYNMEHLSYTEILHDWARTLSATAPYTKQELHCISFEDLFYISAGFHEVFDDKVTEPSLDDVMWMHNGWLQLEENEEPLSVFFNCPDVGDDRSMFAKLFLSETPGYEAHRQAEETGNWAAFGFVATLLSNSIQYYYYNQAKGRYLIDQENAEQLYKALSSGREDDYFYPVIPLKLLGIDFNFTYIDLIKKYLEVTADIVKSQLSYDPKYPLDLQSGNNIYSYIYSMEKNSYSLFKANRFYSKLTEKQKRQIESYFSRYLQYLENEYGANEEVMDKINMREYGQVEPIKIVINTHMKVTDKDGNDVTLERARMSGWMMPGEQEEPAAGHSFQWFNPDTLSEDKRAFENRLRVAASRCQKGDLGHLMGVLMHAQHSKLIAMPKNAAAVWRELKEHYGFTLSQVAFSNAWPAEMKRG